MRATVTRGRTVKTVLVTGITVEGADEIVAFAMLAAGETRGSLFGSAVQNWNGDTATVALYTD